jgi:hypothetical protein
LVGWAKELLRNKFENEVLSIVSAVVTPVHPDPTFQLDQHAGLQMSKIGPPPPFCMEAVFSLQRRAANGLPKHQEVVFEAGHPQALTSNPRLLTQPR